MSQETVYDFVEVDGLRLRYYRTGDGGRRPLILGMSPHHKKATHYAGILRSLEGVADLAPGFTLDGPCVGDSDDVPIDYFRSSEFVLPGLAKIWKEAILKLEVDTSDCIILAHCSGCAFASYLIDELKLKPRLAVLSAPLKIEATGEPGVKFTVGENGLYIYTLESFRQIHPAATEEDVRAANERAYRVRPLRVVEPLPWDTFRYGEVYLPNVARTVIVHPERDAVALDVREALARELDATLHVVPGAGHDPDDASRPAWTGINRNAIAGALAEA